MNESLNEFFVTPKHNLIGVSVIKYVKSQKSVVYFLLSYDIAIEVLRNFNHACEKGRSCLHNFSRKSLSKIYVITCRSLAQSVTQMVKEIWKVWKKIY